MWFHSIQLSNYDRNVLFEMLKYLTVINVFGLQVAIYGKNFCTSARDAFFLLMRNMIRWLHLFVILEFGTNALEFIFQVWFHLIVSLFCLQRIKDCLSSFRVAVLDKVTDFLLFLGKLLIVGLVGESVYIILVLNTWIFRWPCTASWTRVHMCIDGYILYVSWLLDLKSYLIMIWIY